MEKKRQEELRVMYEKEQDALNNRLSFASSCSSFLMEFYFVHWFDRIFAF